MKGALYSILTLIGVASLTGCNTMNEHEGYSREAGFVRVNNTIPHGCRYLGEVSSGSFESMPVTSHAAIEASQMNRLRSRSYQMGANTVIISSHKPATYYGEYIISTGKMSYGLDVHAITGYAYYCPFFARHHG